MAETANVRNVTAQWSRMTAIRTTAVAKKDRAAAAAHFLIGNETVKAGNQRQQRADREEHQAGLAGHVSIENILELEQMLRWILLPIF
jgi:hypothetical protein